MQESEANAISARSEVVLTAQSRASVVGSNEILARENEALKREIDNLRHEIQRIAAESDRAVRDRDAAMDRMRNEVGALRERDIAGFDNAVLAERDKASASEAEVAR